MTKNIISILLVFVLLLSFTACRKLKANDNFEVVSNIYVTDDQGEKHDVMTAIDPSNGETHYYYVNGSGEVVTVASNKVVVETSKIPVTTLPQDLSEFLEEISGMDSEEAFDKFFSGEQSDIQLEISPELLPSDNFVEEETKTDSQGRPLNNRVDPVAQASKGGKYTVESILSVKSGDEKYVVPMVQASDGKSYYVKTSIPANDGKTIDVAVIVKDDGCWMLFPSVKGYAKIPVDDVGDMIEGFNMMMSLEGQDDDLVYVQSGSLNYEGVNYDVDVYKSKDPEDDVIVKKFYVNGELRRQEVVSGDNESIFEYKSVKTTCDSSLFKIPKGYLDFSPFFNELNIDALS